MPTYKIKQDKDADLSYWLNVADVAGVDGVTSAQVDPDSELPAGELEAKYLGVNSEVLRDDDGNIYPVNTVVAISLKGGNIDTRYSAVVRLTLKNGDKTDRTLTIDIVDK